MSDLRDSASSNPATSSGSLDDLFRSARSVTEFESAPLAAESSKRAILNTVMHSSAIPAPTVGIFGRTIEAIHFNLTSTIMTITGLTAAALVAASFLTSPAPTPILRTHGSPANPAENSRATRHGESAVNRSPTIATVIPRLAPFALVTEDVVAAKTSAPSIDSLVGKVDLGGIKPIELSKEQLQKLAITSNDKGDVVFYYHDADQNGTVERFIFPAKAGMKFLSSSITAADTEGLAIQDFFPRMVTNADGQKRFFHFESNTFAHSSNNGVISDSSSSSRFVMSEMNDESDRGDENESIPVPPTPPTPPTPPAPPVPGMHSMQVPPAPPAPPVPPAPHVPRPPHSKSMRQMERDVAIDTAAGNKNEEITETVTDTTDANGTRRIINRSVIVRGDGPSRFARSSDSIPLRLRRTQNGNPIKVGTMTMIEDSALTEEAFQDMGVNLHLSVDSMLAQLGVHGVSKMIVKMNRNGMMHDSLFGLQMENAKKELEMAHLRIDSASKRMSRLNIDSIIHQAFAEIHLHQPDVNKLIPVLVRNNVGGHENALILWYDATPQVIAQLPKESVRPFTSPASPNGALTGLNTYPNPASKSTTIHFTLGDTRSVNFAIYSLLGQKMLDGGTITDHAIGEGELSLDVSKLDAGVYLLIGKTDRGEQLTQRIVVEK